MYFKLIWRKIKKFIINPLTKYFPTGKKRTDGKLNKSVKAFKRLPVVRFQILISFVEALANRVSFWLRLMSRITDLWLISTLTTFKLFLMSKIMMG